MGSKKKATTEQQEQALPAPVATDPRILEVQNALAAFPSLLEGYLCNKGVYFDKEIAESKLGEGEELIIVQRLKKK